MEELRSSRRPAKSSHGDVFGGVPRLSAAKSNDYAEIFGGVASSCSIPFLDLPPSNESEDRDGVIDYLEIFGGFKAGEFAVDYEEWFGKKATERVQMEAKFSQPVGASDLFPEGASANQDYGACPEKSKSSSCSIHSDDISKQFNMSYHRTSRGSIEDVIPGKTHITQLDAISGSTSTVNSCSLQDGGSNHFSNIQANDLIHIVSCNGQLNDAGQDKMSSLASSSDDTKSYGADLKSNEKEFSTNLATSENVPVHMKRHSHSSGNYSASSGDIPYPDVTYVSISDISLRTKPSRLPPPSRAPPKLISKQEDTKVKTHPRGDQDESSLKPAWTPQIHYSIGSAKSHGLQGFAKENSSGFLDVEMDTSSALAASAAAMKEAMEQAQARLKSAKELMDRKRDGLQSRKKMGHKETVKFDERKGVKSFEEGRMFSEVTAKKPLHKEDKEMKEHALDDVPKVIKVGKEALDGAEKEKYTVAPEESQQVRQWNGFVSSQVCHKSEEVSGEWRTEKQIYELINNAKKFGTFNEAFKQEDFEKKSKMTSNLSENDFETVEIGYEFNGTVEVRKISETIETQKINDNSKAHNAIHKEEIGKKPEKVTETCMSKESALEDSHSCHHQNCNKRFQTAQEALPRGEEQSKQNDVVEASCGENKLNVESSNDDVKFEEFYHDDKESNFQAVKEAFEHDDKEKQSGESYVISESYEIDKKLKMSGGRGAQVENENDVRVATAACVREVEEDACLFENSVYAEGNGKVESCYEESECKLEDSEPINANEENGACMTAENDFNDQDGNEVKKNSEELESAPDIIELQRTEERMNLAKESCCPDHNSMETTGTHHGHQQDEKEHSTEESPSVVKRTVEPGVLRHDHSEGENGNFKEDSKALGSEDMDNKFDATEGILETSDNKDIEDVQGVSKSEKTNLKDASQEVCQNFSLSHAAKETVMTGETENFNHEMHKREKLECMKTKEKERGHEKEQARKVEDEKERERGREKEREREREKDRLAMERATRESHERAARERVERIAVERATAEARQRALTEAREKAERAAAEALEKSLAEKALKEAKLRAERAAVERATAEARERAVEKALADKAAADARQRAERLNTISRDKIRKDNEAGEYSMASDKNDLEMKHKANSSDVPNNLRFQSAELSGSSQIYSDSSAHGEVESPLRCKARLERHQRTVERAAKALLEKNLRDILAQRELAERNRLAESLDADVRRWSTGKEGNLRALLSTLQYILGPESGWQPIPLTDVITAVAVKKAYRKATLYVHPDKLQQRGASIQQKYICEKVFDLLKEAWNRFNSEER